MCGALGSGKETSIGACGASPFVIVLAIACAGLDMVVGSVEVTRGNRSLGATSELLSSPPNVHHHSSA